MDCGFKSFTADIFTPESEYYYGLGAYPRLLVAREWLSSKGERNVSCPDHDRIARNRTPGQSIPMAPQRTGQRDSPQLPNVTPGLTGVLSLSTLKAKVSPARISFTARPLTSA